jgi:hypothetical protein
LTKRIRTLNDNDQNESGSAPIEFFQPKNMFGWADIKADKVNLLPSLEKNDYFHPKYHEQNNGKSRKICSC